MTHSHALYLTEQPSGEHWNVGLAAGTRLWLMGWSASGPDCGVPAAIAEVISQALTRTALVTFPSSDAGLGPPDVVRELCDETPFLRRWRARLPRIVRIVSTRSPDTMQASFGDSAYPWWMQGQVLLLSDPGVGPPAVSYSELAQLLEPRSTVSADLLPSLRLTGLLRPGVDGDVAALYLHDQAAANRILAELTNTGASAGVTVRNVTEDELGASLG